MKIFQQHGMLSYTYLSTVLFIHMANVCRHFIVYAIQWLFKHLLCKLTNYHLSEFFPGPQQCKCGANTTSDLWPQISTLHLLVNPQRLLKI